MKRIRLLLALIAASICSVQGTWARTAPTLPEAQTLESGKTYYLYNVGSDMFASRNGQWDKPIARTDDGKAIKISLVNGTQYSLQYSDDNYYWYSNSEWIYVSTSNGNNRRFTMQSVDGGYIIQRVENSEESQYLGVNETNSNEIKTNLTGGNIVWQLLDPAEAAYFIAKRNLYRALESSEGYNIENFEAVYENEASSAYALQEAADRLNKALDASNTIPKPSWSDYNILFDMDVVEPWKYSSTDDYFGSYSVTNGTKILNATIVVDDDATLVYNYYRYNAWSELKVYLDDELQYIIESEEGATRQNYFLELTPGKHHVSWQFVNTNTDGSYCEIGGIGVEHTPTINVNLLEPGSLGTEVLKNTDHIQNVRKLIINGPMNSDDWERIKMMTSLFTLDLTNAEATEIPAQQFYSNNGNTQFLHEVKLPKTLKSIGNDAFNGTYLEDMVFPEGLETIGYASFRYSRIKSAILPETVTLIDEYAFANNESLKNVSYPVSAKSIPNGCFWNCVKLQPFEIPEGIVSIERNAFAACRYYRTSIPTSVTSIGTYAFSECNLDNVVISENASVSDEAFQYSKLKTIEFPTSMYSAPTRVVRYCTSMTDIYLKSPTMVTPNEILKGCNSSILTVHVPDYLVNTYKQDSYWYNYNIVGFSTADVQDWYINRPLTLREGERLEGTPNITLQGSCSLTINGDAPMTINDLSINRDWNDPFGSTAWNTQILSNSDNISVEGELKMRYYCPEKRWVFVCLPFDAKVGDIVNNNGAQFVVRYYDGANRAQNGTGGNWKNYSKDDIIPAGTGFIFQTSKGVWSTFKAQDNETKQYVVSNKEFVKSLAANESESTANKGWNLVGNPWHCYYNIHRVNFTAPITVWNIRNRNYSAYSIIDDDYAILPNEAFFVQCPDEVNSISFPIEGRQLTRVIESQNAARSSSPSARKLIDVELSDGELSDKTRFVMNPQAEMGYELSSDASKFFSMDAAVPQIYTIEQGEQLAINERPLGDGSVQLGIRVAEDGTYTISASRNQFKNIVLVDNETGTETELNNDGSYTFTASAGTHDSRFALRVGGTTVTEIDYVKQNDAKADRYFNLNGQNVTTPTKGVYVVNGKKVVVK